jgi:hypothetical protein
MEFHEIFLFVYIFISLFVAYFIERYIERNDKELFDRLGSPHLIMNNSISNGCKFIKFIFRREHKTIFEGRVVYLCDLWMIMTSLFPFVFALYMYSVFNK